MLAWLRHLSTAVGTAEIMTEALSDSEEAQEYQQAQTAIVLQTVGSRACTCSPASGCEAACGAQVFPPERP